MARKRGLYLLFALFIVATLNTTFLINSLPTTQAAASDSIDVQVDHAVQIRNGGLIVINDTVKLSTGSGEIVEPLQNFLLGFPLIYRSNLTYVSACDSSNRQLDVEPNVGLGREGFYGVEVGFPQSINISNGANYEFTATFVLSNLISSQMLPPAENETKTITFNATFPAYPSLTETASAVNLTIVMPSNLEFLHSSFDDENITFTNRAFGAFQIFNYTKHNLESFAYKPFWLSFEGMLEGFPIIEAEKIKREIEIESPKRVLVSDYYEITTKAGNLSRLTIQLLQGAYEITAWDEFGRTFEEEKVKIVSGIATAPTSVNLTFSNPLIQNEPTKFKVSYQVPSENIISQGDWQNYRIAFSSFENLDWIIRKLTVVLTLPEGAELTSMSDSGVVQKSVFQETLNFVYYNVTLFQDLSREATYRYNIFWTSFRPTLWVGTAAAILSVLALLWRAPRSAAPIPTILVKPEELRSYVDAYEQKRRSLTELETLEEKARKRKIPRRRYKVRKRALESRLSVLSKDLARLREKLQTASSKYADMMRQIEIAEAELEGIEAGIRRTETRYRRGEISTAAYHKLLEDYYRRRERARTTIDGVLIRLREEIA